MRLLVFDIFVGFTGSVLYLSQQTTLGAVFWHIFVSVLLSVLGAGLTKKYALIFALFFVRAYSVALHAASRSQGAAQRIEMSFPAVVQRLTETRTGA